MRATKALKNLRCKYVRKNWPQKRSRRFFALLRLFLRFFSREKKITQTHKSNIAQKKRDATRQSFQKSVSAHHTRKAFTLSVALRTRRRTNPNTTRGLGRNTRTHTHSIYYFGNWNGPQPRKDYEFSREEFYYA